MCQFLLGTVQRKMFKSVIEFLETTECQFLLGTIQHVGLLAGDDTNDLRRVNSS